MAQQNLEIMLPDHPELYRRCRDVGLFAGRDVLLQGTVELFLRNIANCQLTGRMLACQWARLIQRHHGESGPLALAGAYLIYPEVFAVCCQGNSDVLADAESVALEIFEYAKAVGRIAVEA